jgi:hypothetical protein
MLEYNFIEKTHRALLWTVLGLAIAALAAEFLLEVEAKTMVIPTLILVIGLSVMELKFRMKRD